MRLLELHKSTMNLSERERTVMDISVLLYLVPSPHGVKELSTVSVNFIQLQSCFTSMLLQQGLI